VAVECWRDPGGELAVGGSHAPVRVVVAEDGYLVREALVRLLSVDPRVRVEGLAVDYASALRLVGECRPDVVVTDVRMPPSQTQEGIELAAELRSSHPETGVVVLSQYAEPAYAIALVAAGARGRGYLLKDRVAELDQLVDAICVVAAGGSVLDPVMVDLLVADRNDGPSVLSRLRPRERQVLREIASGSSNRAVAAKLVLSPRAIEKHINAIFAKLGLAGDPSVDHRVGAVLLFLSDSEQSGDGPPTRWVGIPTTQGVRTLAGAARRWHDASGGRSIGSGNGGG
jgi:DNA-binding NarL/FixJ family response regulator